MRQDFTESKSGSNLNAPRVKAVTLSFPRANFST